MIATDTQMSDLESRAIAQFDALVSKGEIFWAETEEIKIEQEPFDVYFRISPITLSKPYNPTSTTHKPAFRDTDPDFELDLDNINTNTNTIPTSHKLILNKYCWLRPQLILHTREFNPQTDLLDQTDFEAAVDVLGRLGRRYMVVFNGGVDAGSSIAHKHLQVFPRPGWETVCERIVNVNVKRCRERGRRGKSQSQSRRSENGNVVGNGNGNEDEDGEEEAEEEVVLPFIYRLLPLPLPLHTLDAKTLHTAYARICHDLHITNNTPHSMMLTADWLMLIPRTSATIQGEIDDALIQGGANAMIGIEWLKTPGQFENWVRYGPMRVLREFGVADGRFGE